jgi:tetratricopeptide (TPR) repeat protein
MAEHPRIEELRRRVDKDPSSIAFAQLGEEYRRAGSFTEAIDTCRAGLQRHPGYLSARVTLGRALVETGEFEDAEAELAQVLESAPENLAAIRGLADIHHRRDNLPQALEYYRRALALAQNDPDLEQMVTDLEREIGDGATSPEVPDGLSFAQARDELMSFTPPDGIAAPTPDGESASDTSDDDTFEAGGLDAVADADLDIVDALEAAVGGNVEADVDEGDIEAVAGDIEVVADEGDIEAVADEGDIEAVADEGDIEAIADEGDIEAVADAAAGAAVESFVLSDDESFVLDDDPDGTVEVAPESVLHESELEAAPDGDQGDLGDAEAADQDAEAFEIADALEASGLGTFDGAESIDFETLEIGETAGEGEPESAVADEPEPELAATELEEPEQTSDGADEGVPTLESFLDSIAARREPSGS